MSRTWAVLRWLLLPWWALQIFSGEKSFHPNPVLGSCALNRRGLFVWRARLAHRMTARRRKALEKLVSAPDRQAFARDGFIVKPGFLSPELFAELIREVESFRGGAGEFKEGDAVTRRIPLTPRTLKQLPACKALLELPEWRALTRYVSSFDADPLVSIQTIFTKVGGGRPDPQTSLHADTFHPTMKAWLFLQDVAEEDGPFSYAPGSHRRTPRREAWERRKSVESSDPSSRKKGGAFRIGKPEAARLGVAKARRFPVKANTLVVADTYGFHARRPSLGPSVRVEIWASSRRNPFLPWTEAPLWSLVQARLVPVTWRLIELRRVFGLPAPQFRQVEDISVRAQPAPWSPTPVPAVEAPSAKAPAAI